MQYTFGIAGGGWRGWGGTSGGDRDVGGKYTHKSVTGADGRHELKVTWSGVEEEPKPINVTAVAAVQDLNKQTQVSHANMAGV